MVSVSQIDQGGRRIERKKIKEFRRVLMFSGDSGDGFLRVRYEIESSRRALHVGIILFQFWLIFGRFGVLGCTATVRLPFMAVVLVLLSSLSSSIVYVLMLDVL